MKLLYAAPSPQESYSFLEHQNSFLLPELTFLRVFHTSLTYQQIWKSLFQPLFLFFLFFADIFQITSLQMTKPKGKGSVVIKLVSMAATGFFYTTTKNPKLPKKLMLRKYDPMVNQHVLFKVIFISSPNKLITVHKYNHHFWKHD